MVDGMMQSAIVIDIGSGVMKAGLSGEEKPSLVFNTYVGRPKHEKIMVNALEQDYFIGKEATEKYKGVIKLKHPIEHGVIQDWDEMEKIWSFIFEKLDVNPKEHPVLLTEPPHNPVNNRILTA